MKLKSFLSQSVALLSLITCTAGMINLNQELVSAGTDTLLATTAQDSTEEPVTIELTAADDKQEDGSHILTADEVASAVAKKLTTDSSNPVKPTDPEVFSTPLKLTFATDSTFTQIAPLHLSVNIDYPERNESKTIPSLVDQKFNITSLTLPAGLETIDAEAFQDYPNLTGRLVIPASVKSIGDRAFAGTKVIPDFTNNPELAVNLDPSVFPAVARELKLSAADDLDSNGILTADEFAKAVSLELGYDVTDPNFLKTPLAETPLSVVFTDDHFKEIKPIYLDNSSSKTDDETATDSKVKDVPRLNLTSLTLHDGLEKIADEAFKGFPNLTGDLVIPDSVTTIGENAFTGTPVTLIIKGSVATGTDTGTDTDINTGTDTDTDPSTDPDHSNSNTNSDSTGTANDSGSNSQNSATPATDSKTGSTVSVADLIPITPTVEVADNYVTDVTEDGNSNPIKATPLTNPATPATPATTTGSSSVGENLLPEGTQLDSKGNVINSENGETIMTADEFKGLKEAEAEANNKSNNPSGASVTPVDNDLAAAYDDDDDDDDYTTISTPTHSSTSSTSTHPSSSTSTTSSSSLPKTGEKREASLAALGALLILSIMSLPIIKKIRRKK